MITLLKRAIAEVIPEAVWQRCYVHFLRNALDHLPRKAVDDCLQELRWLYDRRDLHGIVDLMLLEQQGESPLYEDIHLINERLEKILEIVAHIRAITRAAT